MPNAVLDSVAEVSMHAVCHGKAYQKGAHALFLRDQMAYVDQIRRFEAREILKPGFSELFQKYIVDDPIFDTEWRRSGYYYMEISRIMTLKYGVKTELTWLDDELKEAEAEVKKLDFSGATLIPFQAARKLLDELADCVGVVAKYGLTTQQVNDCERACWLLQDTFSHVELPPKDGPVKQHAPRDLCVALYADWHLKHKNRGNIYCRFSRFEDAFMALWNFQL